MKQMRKQLATMIALSILGVSSANAELIIEDGNSKATINGSSTATITTPTITNVGNQTLKMRPAPYKSKNITEKGIRIITAPVDGWGDNIELSIVLKQIVPDGWKAETQNFMDLDQKVSWKSDKEAWIDVFGRIADQNNFKATVDWDQKRIDLIGNGEVTKTTKVVTKKSEPVSIKQTQPLKPATSLNLKPMDVKEIKPVVVQKVWTLKKEKTLRENIEDWAKEAGYIVEWDAPNYQIISDINLKGELDAIGGPFDVISRSYKNAEQPLEIKIYRGNEQSVIRVKSSFHEQETVVRKSIGDEYIGL